MAAQPSTSGPAADPDTITPCPAPWTCRATIYTMAFWIPEATAQDPSFHSAIYAPHEGHAPFGSADWGKPRGGISMIQLIRYTETPAGSYDELVVVPGSFEYPDAEGKPQLAPRISRIYVSQRNTCWNGRKNWNIPKHIAKFDITENADGSASFKVFPIAEGGDKPVFQAEFKPWRYLPYFPISTRLGGLLGVNLACVQPPLPGGVDGAYENGGPDTEADAEAVAKRTPDALAAPGAEIVGTKRWCKIHPYIYSGRSCAGTFDMQQADGSTFIGGLSRWIYGAKMENALLTFGDGEFWDTYHAPPPANQE